MDSACGRDCSSCPGQFLCRCLGVTEETVVEAITAFGLGTLHEVRRLTGAGDGCNCCHTAIRRLLELHVVQSPSSSSPICSVR